MKLLYEPPPAPHACQFPLWLYEKPVGTIIGCHCGKVYASVMTGEGAYRRWDEVDPDEARRFIAQFAPPLPTRTPPWRRRNLSRG